MVRLVSKGKPTMVCPYMFDLYKEHQVLRSLELATYTLTMEMIKYNCTPEPEPNPTASQFGSECPRPIPTFEKRKKRKTSANKRAKSSAPIEDPSTDEPSAFEVERNV